MAISLIKTKLWNKMDDDFLANYLITYIEKEIAQNFEVDDIINDFYEMKERRLQFVMPKIPM